MKAKLLIALKLLLRFALGLMWTITGWSWLSRSDATTYLQKALQQAMDSGNTFNFYQPFLEQIVMPNAALFVGLVAWGEFLTGLSLMSGTLVRFSSWVGVFLLLNYSLMNGTLFSPISLIMIGLQVSLFFIRPGSVLGVDGWLEKRRNKSKGLF